MQAHEGGAQELVQGGGNQGGEVLTGGEEAVGLSAGAPGAKEVENGTEEVGLRGGGGGFIGLLVVVQLVQSIGGAE